METILCCICGGIVFISPLIGIFYKPNKKPISRLREMALKQKTSLSQLQTRKQ